MAGEDAPAGIPASPLLAGSTADLPPLGLGLVGCGGFGRFCLEAYRGLPGLALVAASDTDPGRLAATAAEFILTPYADYAAMLADRLTWAWRSYSGRSRRISSG